MIVALDVVASEASERQAASLIKRNRVKDPSSWDPPSAEKENDIIEAKGWEVYGRWFLGREENADPETKGAYKYPYSADFANVDRRGLVAIRQRAGQSKEQQIFDAAGRLLGLIEEPEPATNARSSFRIAMRKRSRYEIDADTGIIFEVSLIQVGEAKGHGIFIDERSLDSALVALAESNLPAYVTHAGAIESDRLLNEIGVFKDFHIEDGKLKAREFRALASFMHDDPARFRRLFDLAHEAPDAFGISLVFDADLFWTFADGSEKAIADDDGKNAIRKIPSVRFKTISSADFVDAPAANDDGLFKSKPDQTPRTLRDVVRDEIKLQAEADQMDGEEPTKEAIELEEPESEVKLAEEETPEEESAEDESTEDGEKKLDVQEEIDRLRDDMGKHDDRLNMLEDGIADLKKEVLGEQAENEELVEQNKKLTAIVAGEDPLPVSEETSEPEESIADRFNAASGTAQTILWQENKQAILASYSRGK